jgi:hypothetical protein
MRTVLPLSGKRSFPASPGFSTLAGRAHFGEVADLIDHTNGIARLKNAASLAMRMNATGRPTARE